MEFPPNLTVPAPAVTSAAVQGSSHGVSSSRVTLLDARTLEIDKLTYDGVGDDAFFYGLLVNDTAEARKAAADVNTNRIKFADEKGKCVGRISC